MSEPKLKQDSKAFCVRITDIYIYIMLFLFPLFTGIEGYANVTLSKFIFFAAVTALWLVALFAAVMVSGKRCGSKSQTFVSIFILLYLLFCCVSAAFSPYKSSVFLGEGRFDGLLTTFLCVGIFIGISLFARPKRTYIYAAAAAVTLNCIVAVLQMLGFNPLHLFPGDYDFYDAGIKYTSTFLGTIGNADLFSAYICLVLPFVCVHYATAEKRPLLLLPTVLLSAFSLFSCEVSGGMLAFAVTVIFAAPFIITDGERLRRALEIALVISSAVFLAVSIKFYDTASVVIVDFLFSMYSAASAVFAAITAILRFALRKSSFSIRPLRVFFSILSAAAVVCGFLAAYFWKGTEGTVYELSQVLHGNIKDSFGSSRILIWRKTLELVPERLLLGGGPGTLPLRLDVDFSRFVEETGKTLSSTVDNAHNNYLGILVNTGLPALIAYVFGQGVSLARALKTAKPEMLCLAFALFCYWVQDFFGLGLFLVSPLMWLFWGLLISSIRHRKN